MNETYRDALDDCLRTLRHGGDVESAIARHPRHDAELRNDIALASALRTAGRRVEPPAGAEGRAGLRMAAALQDARAARTPARRGGFSLGGWLRPVALAGFAALLLAIIGLGALNNAGSLGGGTAEAATLEGVVVSNANGTLTLQTNTGLETVSLDQSAVLQDDAAHTVVLGDITVGQIVTAHGKKPGNGPFIAKQLLSKSPAQLQAWCSDHADACQALLPRLESQISGCTPADAAACQRLKQPLQDTRTALQQIGTDLSNLKDRCDGGGQVACKTLERACKQHPMLCQELRQRQSGTPGTGVAGGSGGPSGPIGGPGSNGGPQRPGPVRPTIRPNN